MFGQRDVAYKPKNRFKPDRYQDKKRFTSTASRTRKENSGGYHPQGSPMRGGIRL